MSTKYELYEVKYNIDILRVICTVGVIPVFPILKLIAFVVV